MGIHKKKEKNLSEIEKLEGEYGDIWGHIGFESITKIVIAHVSGKRTLSNTRKLVKRIKEKMSPDSSPLYTSDERKAYKTVLLEENSYSIELPPRTGKPGRPRKPKLEPLPDLKYAVVEKYKRKGRIVKIETKVVFGDEKEIKSLLSSSPVSNSINISFVERNNLTLRQKDKRLERKSLGFSKKAKEFDNQLTLTIGHYHFVKPHGGLRCKDLSGIRKWIKRTPAMAAGKTDHIWSFEELLIYKIPP